MATAVAPGVPSGFSGQILSRVEQTGVFLDLWILVVKLRGLMLVPPFICNSI